MYTSTKRILSSFAKASLVSSPSSSAGVCTAMLSYGT
jgi:hypothetical protein